MSQFHIVTLGLQHATIAGQLHESTTKNPPVITGVMAITTRVMAIITRVYYHLDGVTTKI